MKGIRGAFVCETRGRAFHVRVSVKRKANATAERAEVNVNLNLSDLSFRSTSWPSSREAKRKKEKRKEKKMAEVWRNEMKLNENASMRQRGAHPGQGGQTCIRSENGWDLVFKCKSFHGIVLERLGDRGNDRIVFTNTIHHFERSRLVSTPCSEKSLDTVFCPRFFVEKRQTRLDSLFIYVGTIDR